MYTSDDLANVSDKEFQEVVDREIRKDHASTPADQRPYLNKLSMLLRHPDVVDRWIAALEIMKASSESQLGAKRAEIKKLHGTVSEDEYQSRLRQYEGWKAGNVRFLNVVHERLRHARYARSRQFVSLYPMQLVQERNYLSEVVTHLIRAIESHRSQVLAEYDPTDADKKLWESINDAYQKSTVTKG